MFPFVYLRGFDCHTEMAFCFSCDQVLKGLATFSGQCQSRFYSGIFYLLISAVGLMGRDGFVRSITGHNLKCIPYVMAESSIQIEQKGLSLPTM